MSYGAIWANSPAAWETALLRAPRVHRSLGLCAKDISLCENLAKQEGVPTPIGPKVAEQFRLAAAAYGEQTAQLYAVKLIEDEAGAELRLQGGFTPHWEA